MIKEGAFSDSEAIFGMHIDIGIPTGSIASISGPHMATTCVFNVKVEERDGNAAMPHSTINPILIASSMILALQQLLSREVDPFQSPVLSVTYVRGGTAFNTIPPFVEFKGTLRSLTTEGLYQLQKGLKEVVKQQAAVHRCNAFIDLKEKEHPPYPAAVNDDSLHLLVESVGKSLLGPKSVGGAKKVIAGEDFAFYQQVIPGVMLSIGIRNEEKGSIHSPHSSHFFLNEDVLSIGVALYANLAETYQNEHQHFNVQ